jgi:GNAT superfamily N-acetyltransferase
MVGIAVAPQDPDMTTSTQRTASTLRIASPDDADACGRIFYDAFASIAERHLLPVEPASPEFTRFMAGRMLGHDGYAGFACERGGAVVGCAFVDERGPIAGVGPVVVDPAAQDDGVGRLLMEAVVARSRSRGAAGIRLVQTAYHYRSLALYAKLGFVVREPLSVVQGTVPAVAVPGVEARPAGLDDVVACDALSERVHGHERGGELRDAVADGTARVVLRDGRLTGYATGFGYGWHAVAEANDDLIALLCAPDAFMGLGLLVPSRNAALLQWCLDQGLRIVQQSTLMTIGLYNEPAGVWLPSIAY